MNNWIDRLERRYSRFAIPYLVNGLMVGQLAAGLIVLLINWQFSGFISLSRSAVLHGQIWRLITFLFQPVWLGGALGILNLVFYFWIGNSLTRAWGDFRMTLFIALGVLGAWISCFLAGGASPDGIFLSMMFAYTWMWPEQGVLLLNAVLTVRAGQAGSHRGHGWERFTDSIISLLDKREKPIVFLLWGADARRKRELIHNPAHTVLTAAHPSPFSAYNGFFGCDHFNKANAALEASGQTPILW